MSRFAWPSRAVVALMIGLVAWGIVSGAPERQVEPVGERGADLILYEAITEKMANGSGYYAAVATEQSPRGYPTRPVMTVREPTLAWLVDAAGGPWGAYGVLLAIVGAAAVTMLIRLRETASSLPAWVVAGLLGSLSLVLMAAPALVHVHEIWAGVLIVLSVGVRSGRRWTASVGVGLAAALIRELAVPYLVVMLVLAYRDRRRDEAIAWGAALAAWGIFYGVHALRVLDLVPAGASASPGWLAAEGWPLFVEMIRAGSVLVLLPFWVAAVTVPLALLGWWTRRTAYSTRVAMTLTGYAVAFTIVGRADTTYWGFLLAALVLPGIAMVPRVLGPKEICRDPKDSSVSA